MTWACVACGGGNPDGFRFCGHCGTQREEAGASVHHRLDQALTALAERQAVDPSAEGAFQERRLVTALFADVSGFTALADRVDEEVLAGVIDPLISRFSAIVARYEGYISKYAGDAILALFGAPISHEDDASRALRAALEMQQALEEMRPGLPESAAHLGVHVGVNTGYVVARAFGNRIKPDYSVLGDAVNVAQRLEAAAGAGEVYVGATTHRLTEARFEFEELPPLHVKGKAEELRAFRLRGARDHHRRDGRDGSAPSFVGRAGEMAVVQEVLARLQRGSGGLVAVLGEPGVGKSRLLGEARSLPEAGGLWWLETPCLTYGSALAYRPFIELLRQVLGADLDQSPQDSASGITASLSLLGVPEAAPYFCRLLGIPGPGTEELAELTPEALRRGLHESFAEWLRALARMQPVVLVVEDLHWSDTSSLDLLEELTAVCADSRVVLWLTSRTEGTERVSRISDRVDDGGRAWLELDRLGRAAMAELVEGVVGGIPESRLVDAVMDRTSGNPFFAEELIRSLLTLDQIERTGSSVRLRRDWDPTSVPGTVEGVLASRLDQLPRPAVETLMVAAVMGRRVRVSLLRVVADGVPDLDDQLGQLVDGAFLDLLATEGEYAMAFHHSLVLDVAYNRLLKRERQRLHLRTAEAAEELYGSGDDVIDLLARHFYLGEGGVKAFGYLLRAADRDERLFANEEAIGHLERAHQVAEREPSLDGHRAGMLLRLGRLHDIVGDYDSSYNDFVSARELGAGAPAWQGMAASLRKRGEGELALELIDLAFATMGDGADTRPLWLEKGWCLGALQSRYEDAIQSLERGLGTAQKARDGICGEILLSLARAEVSLGRLDDALVHCQEARAIFDESQDLRRLTIALRILGGVHEAAGRLDEAASTLRLGLERAERIGSNEEIGACLINLGLVELIRGNLDVAIECDERAIDELERSNHATGLATAYANLAEKLDKAGRPAELAEQFCRKGMELAGRLGNRVIVADGRQTMASILAKRGDYAGAAAWAMSAAHLFESIGDGRAETARALADSLIAEGARTLGAGAF